MRKSTMFISAVLTTFMLAIMFGVASAYQKIVQTGGTATEVVQQVQPTDAVVAAPVITTGTVATVTLEEAAALASSVLGRTDLYAAENSTLNGVDAYLVTFSSGDLVYVGLDGKVLSITKIPVQYVQAQSSARNNGGGSSNDAPAAPSVSSSSPVSSSSDSNDDHHGDHDGGGDGDDD